MERSLAKPKCFTCRCDPIAAPGAPALAGEVCSQLEQRFQTLRGAKYQSIIDELQRAEKLAQTNLDRTTQRLSQVEGSVGADLAELRSLQNSSTANGDLRQKVLETQNEIRFQEAEDEPQRAVARTAEIGRGRPGPISGDSQQPAEARNPV